MRWPRNLGTLFTSQGLGREDLEVRVWDLGLGFINLGVQVFFCCIAALLNLAISSGPKLETTKA